MTDFTAARIAPGITRITDVGQVYMYLVQGSERALLIDTGYGYGDLAAFVRGLTELPLEVVCTHGHVDHAGGAGGFERVWLHEADWELAKQHTRLETRARFLQSLDGFDPEKLLPAREAAYESLQSGQIFQLGDCTVTAISLTGHTQGSMAILMEPQQVLLLGDACNSATFLFFNHSSTVGEYRQSLLGLRAWDDRYRSVLFSHTHNFGGKEVVEESISLCDAILAGTNDGVPFEALDKVVLIDGYIPERVRAGKKLAPDFSCADGSCANIWYDVDRIQ